MLYSNPDVNAQSSNGNTPLHQAMLLSTQSRIPEAAVVDIIALLLQAGADPNLNNGGGSSPLALARQGAGLPTIKALLSLDCAGAKVPQWKSGAASCADSCPVEASPHGGACVFCPAGEICKTDILGCCAACPAGTNAVSGDCVGGSGGGGGGGGGEDSGGGGGGMIYMVLWVANKKLKYQT